MLEQEQAAKLRLDQKAWRVPSVRRAVEESVEIKGWKLIRENYLPRLEEALQEVRAEAAEMEASAEAVAVLVQRGLLGSSSDHLEDLPMLPARGQMLKGGTSLQDVSARCRQSCLFFSVMGDVPY